MRATGLSGLLSDIRRTQNQAATDTFQKCPYLLARSEGFEPPTPRFEVWCSIQLSYERGKMVAYAKTYNARSFLEALPPPRT